ncbi:MAG: hypothetical protein ACTH2Q_20150 [Propionibacteriaceae bacterium]
MTKVLRGGVAVILIVISLGLLAKVGWSAYGPRPGPEQLADQVRFLEGSVDEGSPAEMQQLFPEGYFFLHALTAMGAAGTESPDPERIRKHLAALDSPAGTDVFGNGMVPEHGIFHAGWTLVLAADLHDVDPSEANARELRVRAEVVAQALAASPTGFAESYPGQYWPCDSVVAAAGLARAAEALDQPQWLDTVRTWRERTRQHVDPATGLLPHRVDADGRLLDRARGSSQSIIQTFLPDVDVRLDGTVDTERWRRFTDQFVDRQVGLTGVREYPRGIDGSGDVDSGPLVLGVSASASAVTLAAARRVGDADLSATLDREAELLGFPLTFGDRRSYALGQLPVGDAFVAFARSRPTPTEPMTMPPPAEPVRPLWEAFLIVSLIPGVLGVLVGARLVGRNGAQRTVVQRA